MRAAVLHSFGGPDNIRVVADHPRPDFGALQADEVGVRVICSGMNPVDTYIRSGNYSVLPALPFVVGRDGAGVVEQVGSAVRGLRAGDRVWFTSALNGTAAEYAIVRQASILPSGMSFEEGACVGIPYLTAHTALFRHGGVDPNSSEKQRLLVHGASGAVGLAAVQLAAALPHIEVVGTAGSQEGERIVKRNGAVECVNHHSKGYVQELSDRFGGFDLVLEMNAQLNLNKSISLLRKGGRVVVIGSRGTIEFDPRSLMQKDAAVVGCGLMNSISSTWPSISASISHFFASSSARPLIRTVYDLDDIAKAHGDVVGGGASMGQIVVRVGGA